DVAAPIAGHDESAEAEGSAAFDDFGAAIDSYDGGFDAGIVAAAAIIAPPAAAAAAAPSTTSAATTTAATSASAAAMAAFARRCGALAWWRLSNRRLFCRGRRRRWAFSSR